jgi:hypothetical protein
MAKIAVPRPGKGSFNKNRPPSDLLRSQMRHLYEVEKQMPHRHQTGRNIEEIKTEGDAAEYIRRVTQKLHKTEKVKVPRPAPGSFHKHRPLSDLLRKQVEHFHEVEMTWPAEQRTGTDPKTIKTETDAASYIRAITAQLHNGAENKQDRNAVAGNREGKKSVAESNRAKQSVVADKRATKGTSKKK